MALLTLVKPRIWGMRNRWRLATDRRTALTRDSIMLFFAAIVAKGIYDGVFFVLTFINHEANLSFLPPVIPLGLIFSLLLAILLFSNTVAAFSSFYLSKDNELLIAAPLPPPTFFFGKMIDIFASSSWMAMIFGAPVLLAFGHAYDRDLWFFADAVFIAIPLFIIPCASACILVTIFASVVSAARTKELFIVAIILGLIAVAAMARILIIAGTSLQNDQTDFLRVVNTFAATNTVWSPAYWAAMYLGEQLQPIGRELTAYPAALYSLAATLTAIGYILVRLLHYRGYSRAQAGRGESRAYRRAIHTYAQKILCGIPAHMRSLIVKDICMITRDISQGTQVLLLLGIAFICLYNFSLLGSVGASLNDAALAWWGAFMIGTSLALGAFVVSAACTRFVFPSMSLEGQSFWILQTCPLSMQQILRAKLYSWIVPISLLSLGMFWAGAMVIHAPLQVIILNILTGLVTAYGIVGLAVGLGAYFANFDWEHSSQLIASFGSLIFMLCSVMLIALNTGAALSISFVRTSTFSSISFTDESWYFVLVMGLALMLAFNHLVVLASLRVGDQALHDRMRR